MNRRDEAFALYKAPHIAEAIGKNLKRATSWLERRSLGYHGRVTVVGAGHTMPLERVPWTVIAVNSALVPIARRGWAPRYILCRESIDMSVQLRKAWELGDWGGAAMKPTAILDIGTHPAFADTCTELGIAVEWFIPAGTQTFGLSATLGREPLYGGTSNVTASVAVAEAMGAGEIRLVGCSRAFAADGRAYAAGSDWESVRLESVEAAVDEAGKVDHYIATIGGLEAKDALHAASGQRPPLKRERVIPVEAIDGTRRWAPETLDGDREWLENFATRHPHLWLEQADPDVAIAGWGHKPRRGANAELPDLRAEVMGDCDRAEAMAAAVLSGEPLAVDVPGILDGSAMVDYAGVSDTILGRRALAGKSPVKTIPMHYRVSQEAARRVRKWVE